MPWMEFTGSERRSVWLRTESILGIGPPEGIGGARLFLLSGEAFEVMEEQALLLQKITVLEGTMVRERRVGFPGPEHPE